MAEKQPQAPQQAPKVSLASLSLPASPASSTSSNCSTPGTTLKMKIKDTKGSKFKHGHGKSSVKSAGPSSPAKEAGGFLGLTEGSAGGRIESLYKRVMPTSKRMKVGEAKQKKNTS